MRPELEWFVERQSVRDFKLFIWIIQVDLMIQAKFMVRKIFNFQLLGFEIN